MYSDISPDAIYQGDVVLNFSFIAPPLGEPIAIQSSGNSLIKTPISAVSNPYSSGSETLVVNSFRASGMIITQTCDIQRHKYISLCPIHPFNEIREKLAQEGLEEKRIQNLMESIKQQKVNYYFYLPPAILDEIRVEESYVDLQVINSVPRENVSNYQRLITLSDKGRHWLDYKLINLFGRPFD